MRKLKTLFLLAFIIVGGNVAQAFCIISSDPAENKMFCRMDSEGVDRCKYLGSGAACSSDSAETAILGD